MVKKIKFMQIWSINLLRFLKANNLRAVSKFVDENGSGKTCWVFEQTEEMESVLSDYTRQKNKALGRTTE